jgi:hypothetical protein
VSESERRRFGGHSRAADMLGRRVLQHAVDDAGSVETGRDREPRDTTEGLNRLISCIQRMYSSRCGRRAASGSRARSAHQVR